MVRTSKPLATRNSSVEVLCLPTVTVNALKRNNIYTVGQLLDFGCENLRSVRSLGFTRLRELEFVCRQVILVKEWQVCFLSRFYDLLNKHHLSLSDFSRKADISLWIVYSWRTRGYSPRVSHLLAVSDLFGVSVDYLCGRG